jgi:hypothetical protein
MLCFIKSENENGLLKALSFSIERTLIDGYFLIKSSPGTWEKIWQKYFPTSEKIKRNCTFDLPLNDDPYLSKIINKKSIKIGKNILINWCYLI